MSTKDTENIAKTFPKLYEKLPEHLGGTSEILGPENVKEFLKEHIPKSDQKEIDEVFAKNLPLTTQQKKKLTKPHPKKREILDRERKTRLKSV